jgi:GGDEF domain-containing protein
MSLLCVEILPAAENPDTLNAASNLFASALKMHMRSADIPCVNGREFKILLPATNQNGLNPTCMRMLSVFKNSFEVEDGSTISFSLYIGGTAHDGNETLSRDVLLEKGQAALLLAKQKGINSYVIL